MASGASSLRDIEETNLPPTWLEPLSLRVTPPTVLASLLTLLLCLPLTCLEKLFLVQDPVALATRDMGSKTASIKNSFEASTSVTTIRSVTISNIVTWVSRLPIVLMSATTSTVEQAELIVGSTWAQFTISFPPLREQMEKLPFLLEVPVTRQLGTASYLVGLKFEEATAMIFLLLTATSLHPLPLRKDLIVSTTRVWQAEGAARLLIDRIVTLIPEDKNRPVEPTQQPSVTTRVKTLTVVTTIANKFRAPTV